MSEHPSKTKLIDAAIDLVRTKGYAATRVDEVCTAAGVTKGSFFHHFATKDELGLAAAEAWRQRADGLFTDLTPERHPDPLDRLLAYLDLRRAIISDDLVEWSCYGGTMIQELHHTQPALRDACQQGIDDHAAVLAPMIQAALDRHRVAASWTADSLARHILAVVQGSIILAKGAGQADVARDCIDHLRRYVEQIFDRRGASS